MNYRTTLLRNFSNWKVSTKLIAGYAVVVAVALLTIAVSLNAQGSVNREITRATGLSASIDDLTNQMKDNIVSSQMALNQYVIQRVLVGVPDAGLPAIGLDSLAAIHLNIADLRALAQGHDEPHLIDLVHKLDAFEIKLSRLETRMSNISADLDALGGAQSGQQGAFLVALNALGARAQEVNGVELRLAILDALGEAQSFLIDGEPAHIGRFHSAMAHFKVLVTLSGQLSDSEKEELLALVDTALADFDKLINLQLSFNTRYNAFLTDSAALQQAVEDIRQIGRSEFQTSLGAVEAVQAVVRSTQIAMLVILVTLIPASLVLAFLIGRNITRPISELLHTTRELARGNLAARTGIDRHDEIGQLALAFNHMSDQLTELYGALQRSNEELELRVTDRTAELEAVNENLVILSQVKDKFVSNVSHELRTPLSNIKLYHTLLGQSPVMKADHLEVLSRETNRLERIIEGLLLLSRLDQGQVSFEPERIDLNAVAERLVLDRAGLYTARDLDLSFAPETVLPSVNADARLLDEAMSILLTNAYQYTPAGGKVVVSTQVKSSNGRSHVGLSVSNDGPAISREEQPHLFERFFRGKAARDSGASGTGLGLAILKEIVTRNGGQVEVVSDGPPASGVTFTLWLPAQPG